MPEYRWLGLSAAYEPDEITQIATIPLREQTFIHVLKSFIEGEIQEPAIGTRETGPIIGKSVGSHAAPPVYTDPEDIPFGDPAPTRRKRPIYALSWTWRKQRVFKTKTRATRSMKAWKKWYERQGWKVSSHADGYFAGNSTGERHSISLHEYDRDTLERIR